MRSHQLYGICVYNIAGYWKLEMELFRDNRHRYS